MVMAGEQYEPSGQKFTAAWSGMHAGAAAKDPDQENHLVTSLLRSDEVILMLAHRALAAGEGNTGALLAARRVLDDEVRTLIPGPSGDDYASAAEDYDRLGRPGDAALLRQIAATDKLLAEAGTQWNTRYDDRPPTPAQQLIESMRAVNLIDFDPVGPLAGADGALYEPGAYSAGSTAEPALVITGRGTTELIVDWPGFDEMHAWVASRGTTAVGALIPPPMHRDCRAWEEDQILARMITSPRDVKDLTAGLRPDTFTTDVRYEIYQATLNLSREGAGYYTPEQIAAELTTRLAGVPAHALPSYGGAAGLFLHAYLHRLTATEVPRETAAITAAMLLQEDDHYRELHARNPKHGTQPELAAGSSHACGSSANAQKLMTDQPVRVGQTEFQRPAQPTSPGGSPVPRF